MEKGPVGNRVVPVAAGFPAHHNVAHTQDCKLLRDVRLFNLECFAELIHTFLAIAKTVEDPDANRVGEGLEELGFEVGELLWHARPFLHAYRNRRISACQENSRYESHEANDPFKLRDFRNAPKGKTPPHLG